MPRPRKDAQKPDAAAQIERRRAVNATRQARHRQRIAMALSSYAAALRHIAATTTDPAARAVARQALDAKETPHE